MKIKDTLQRDPAAHPLVNQGQARISDSRNERTQSELRGELVTFVCEGQYAEGVQKIIRSFLDNLGKTSQRGAWVSGFFGSGKSHLLKMLCHLWQDTSFPDGATARSLVPSIPDDLRALLRELDTAGKRAGGLIAAAGALPSGTTDNVRLTILAILLRAVDLPEQYPQARFCLWLHSQGQFDKVKAAVEAAGKSFERELNNLYVSGPIAQAVMASEANFAASEADAKQLLKAQFPPQVTDITTEQFLLVAKEALKLRAKDGRLPCTLLILDEAQQYIGDSQQRASLLTEVTEAASKQLDSHVMVVAAGQSALAEIQLLTYLLDRFTIRVPLSDAEVETVTRKVLLQKKPSAVADVRALLVKHAGEVSRQLQGTRIGESMEDRAIIVDDYPLLPVRRRFWEHCFRQIDAAGTSSQLRSQLRIIHDAVAKVSDRPLGSVVPADDLFEALAPEMVNTGVLLREINERIILVGRTEGAIAQRICGLVFLIGKLKREAGADIGVRATKDHLADLLIDDLSADNGKLRAEVEDKLKKLSDQGVLMLVGDEYRLQTREGSDWDREFRNRQTKLNNDDAAIQFKRDQLLYGEIDKTVRAIRVIQGAAKEPRQFLVHREQTSPIVDGSNVPIWIRDGWSCAEKDVLDAARSAGNDSPVLFVFIPRQSADDLRRLVVEADATQQTIDAKGHPTTAEGQEARQSMDSRRARAVGDQSSSVIVPKDEAHLPAITAFVMSRDFHDSVRQIDPSVAVTNATFVKVPFDLAKWADVAGERFPDGLPEPFSDDPTQWLFGGSPTQTVAPLLVASARLLGYRWPRQSGSSFMDCPALDPDGLEKHADADGIICLTALKGEPPAAERLNTLLADSLGADWSAAKLASLLTEAGFAGKTLDDWLRDGFFVQHCQLFHQRPFVWHVWDGRRDGFHALVNYHRLAAPGGEGRRTLEKLIYSYLGDWIDRQRADQKSGIEGADGRLAAAEHLRAELTNILQGEPPYDILVRWKPLHEQPIGWEPDINDGVRINVRPFMNSRPLGARGANACILRSTPKIKWDKDRGKEPTREKADYPWFWGWDEAGQDFVGAKDFDGNRWNDLHYRRAAKQAARDRHHAKAGGKK